MNVGRTFLVFWVLFALCSWMASAQETPSVDRAKAEAERAGRMARDELRQWTLSGGGERERPMHWLPQSVLRWSNPGVGRVYGEVFVGVENGHPQAVLSIYKWFDPYHGFEAEVLSLAASPLVARRDGQTVWNPISVGLETAPLPGAPAPGDTAAGRFRQMRSLAREFTGLVIDRRVHKEGEEQALRLLPQPVYRYASEEGDVLDSGLFAFVVGTDPEVFLLLQAVTAPSRAQWRYGLARMNSDELIVLRKGKRVWTAALLDSRGDAKATYVHFDLLSE